nr:MAG TPA: hypothetical protein [Caudoviricetes sp.]
MHLEKEKWVKEVRLGRVRVREWEWKNVGF